MIDIKENCNGYSFGYVFRLESKSDHEGQISLDESTVVVFVRGSYYVYLNSNEKVITGNTMQAFEKLQRALDYLSLRGIQNSSVKVPFGHYLKWKWIDRDYDLTLIQSAISRIGTSRDMPKLTMENYHEGFRFYRFAQISHDLYESFRHLWLSFESLITTYSPRKRQESESEYNWYVRALTQLKETVNDVDLDKLIRQKPIEELMSELYTDTRCSLFHSKHGKSCLIPHQIEEYERVKQSLSELTIVVLAIITHCHSIKTKRSWTNPIIFVETHRELFSGAKLFISNSETENKLSEDDLLALQESTIPNDVSHKITERENCVEHRFTSNATTRNIALEAVRRFSFIKEDKELLIFTLDEHLCLNGVSTIVFDSILDFGFREMPRCYDYRI